MDSNAEMVERLVREGWLRSPEWRAAFLRVPRGRFVASPDVFADEALITRVDRHGVPISSCSAPSNVAGMLEALDVSDGMSVLEIGTGTGWNAGLLSARLGDGLVTSLDIDPSLVEHARHRLAALDLRPTLEVADGLDGLPARAPYDRVIATCAVRSFPAAWLRQTRAGGHVLADIRGPLAGALARVTVDQEGTASGGFRSERFSFMPLRSPRVGAPALSELGAAAVSGTGVAKPPGLAPAALDDWRFAFFAQLELPGAITAPISLVEGPTYFCLMDPRDGSWARAAEGTVSVGGRRDIWAELEAAHRMWTSLGAPDPGQFMITIDPTGLQQVIHPGTSRRWSLPI